MTDKRTLLEADEKIEQELARIRGANEDDNEYVRSCLGRIDEASLSRIFRQSKQPFAILTAFKNTDEFGKAVSRRANVGQNRDLIQRLNALKAGAARLVGHWIEGVPPYKNEWNDSLGKLVLNGPDGVIDIELTDKGDAKFVLPTGETISKAEAIRQGIVTDSVEDSLWVPMPKGMDVADFRDLIAGLVKDYRQEAAVFGDGSNVSLLDRNGKLDKIGSKVSMGKIGIGFSQLRKRPQVPFVFEGVAVPSSNYGKMLFTRLGLIYEFGEAAA